MPLASPIMTSRAVFLCVTIDCECDKGPQWRTQLPLAFAGISVGIGHRLQPLFNEFEAKPTYLLSAEVMRHQPSVECLGSLGDACELGTHLHTEFLDPQAQPLITRHFQCHDSAAVETEGLTTLTQLFEESFGRRPTSFRAGRFGVGPATLPILQSLGYTVDSSVTPFLDWTSAGARGLSFRGAPTQPYFPEASAAHRRGTFPVLEVPVTIRPRWLSRIPGLGWLEPRWLRPTRNSGPTLVALAREEIRENQSGVQPIVLNAMFHNVEVVAGASPYASNEDQVARILSSLRGLLEFCQEHSIPVIKLCDVPQRLASAQTVSMAVG